MRVLFIFLFSISLLFSKQIKPSYFYEASAGVSDLVLKDKLLYVATANGSLDIFNIETKQLIQKLEVPKIKDFLGEQIAPKIFSVDIIKNKILLVTQGEKGFRKLYEFKNNSLKSLITIDNKMSIVKAKYINENQILLSLLSNQLFLYDIKNQNFLWEVQVSHSKFSDFAVNEEKTKVVIADESGDLKQFDIKTGKLKKIYSGLNVDNIFQIDMKKDIIITAGQDRRCGIYQKYNQYYKKSNFLIYSAGLSPSGTLAGFANNEENDITIFNTDTKKELFTLKGHKITLTNILFKNENELFSSSDGNIVYYWNLKE